MDKHKAALELPHFLLPRLSWSQAASKSCILSPSRAKVHTCIKDRQAPSLSLHRFPDARNIHTVCPSQQIHLSASALAALQTPKRPCAIAADNAGPIRHNGIYVALFKPAKRAFSASRSQAKDHHFDTLKFVQRLKGEGISEEQAVAMMRVLNDVIEESIQNLTRTMVLKEGNYFPPSSSFSSLSLFSFLLLG